MKKLYGTFAVLGCFMYLFSSCNTRHDQNDVTEEIARVWAEFTQSWNQLDARGCASFYAIDGVNIPPGLEKRAGREDIESFYQWLFEDHSAAIYKHQIISVSQNGNWAVEEGIFKVDWTRKDGSDWFFDARSLTHWEKNNRGDWKIKAFIFNRP